MAIVPQQYESDRYLIGSPMRAMAAGEDAPAEDPADASGYDPARLSRAREIAHAILMAFNRHFRIFREATQNARQHFIDGDWQAARQNSSDRLSLYDLRIREAIADLRTRFGLQTADPLLWQEVKFQYLGLLYNHRQPELAETFYNSVFVGLFERHFYHNDNIFVRPSVSTERIVGDRSAFSSFYPTQYGWRKTLRDLLDAVDLGMPFRSKRRDVANLFHAVAQLDNKLKYLTRHFQLHVLNSVFYRNKAAYIVGRAVNGPDVYPFVIPILRDDNGEVYVDALVTEPDDVANLFSFARTYFFADCEVPSSMVRFMLSFLPGKSAADLYTAIGFHKQGKAEFYRDFLDHLRNSSDHLMHAPGIKGMVMLVFTLPSYPYVFKVIRDKFASVKKITEQQVIEKNRYIKRQDRVGRMADTWEFSYAAFPVDRFTPELLAELQDEAGNKVSIEDGQVIIKHLYIERRLTPLNLYLEQEADDLAACLAMREYGNALREISGAGVFPGDLLLKNFGVTRHGRVIFYDYDEIVPIAECNFRDIPEPRTPEQEMASEPWYSIAENDIFPEEFATFLISNPKWRKMFRDEHGDLLSAAAWKELQHHASEGKAPDVYPYRREIRFHR